MTAKEFFKSTAFKALAVLLAITIVAGGLLAIFNDLLYISDEERFNRVIEQIYGGNAKVEKTILSSDDEAMTFDNGTVSQVYLMNDGNYLIQATGKNGYNGGTVTVWVVHKFTASSWKGIGKVVYESNTSQTQMGTFSSSYYELFTQYNDEILDDMLFSAEGEANTVPALVAGSSRTSRAFCNAVNTSILYIKSEVLGQAVETYTYEYEKYVDMENSTIEANLVEGTVAYKLTMKSNPAAPSIKFEITAKDGKIDTFKAIGPFVNNWDESKLDSTLIDGTFFVGKTAEEIVSAFSEDDVLTPDTLTSLNLATGASRSSETFFRAAAFATANFDAFLTQEFLPYASYIDFEKSVITSDFTNNSVTYQLVTKTNGIAPAITFEITANESGITAFKATAPFVNNWNEELVDSSLKDGTYFVGKTAEQLTAALSDDEALDEDSLASLGLATGASRSSESFFRAAAFAAANVTNFLTESYYPLANYVSDVTATESEGAVTVTLTTKSNGIAPAITFEITVKDGTITAFEATAPFVNNWNEELLDSSLRDGTYFVGKTAAQIEEALLEGEALDEATLTSLGFTTGASRSSESFFRAALYAATNYDKLVAEGGE